MTNRPHAQAQEYAAEAARHAADAEASAEKAAEAARNAWGAAQNARTVASAEPTPRPRLLSVEETAEMLGKTPAAFRYQIHKGTAPPSAKILGRRMFRDTEVRAWLDAQFNAE